MATHLVFSREPLVGLPVHLVFGGDDEAGSLALAEGLASVSGVGRSLFAAVASASGSADAVLYAIGGHRVVASAAGLASVAGVGVAIARASYLAAGAATGVFQGAAIARAAYAAAGHATVHGLGKQKKNPYLTVVDLGWIGVPNDTDLHENINEAGFPNDSDFCYSAPNGALATLGLALQPGVLPLSRYDRHTLRLRLAQVNDGVLDGSGNAVLCTVSLRNGVAGSVVVSQTFALMGDWFDYSIVLSNAQIDAITSYADLVVELVAQNNGGATVNRRAAAVSWIQLEYGPMPAPVEVETVGSSNGLATVTGFGAAITAGNTTASSLGRATVAAVARWLHAATGQAAGVAPLVDAEGLLIVEAAGLAEGQALVEGIGLIVFEATATSFGEAQALGVGRIRLPIAGPSMYTVTVAAEKSRVLVPADCSRQLLVPQDPQVYLAESIEAIPT